MTVIELPFPVSTNQLYANVAKRGRVKTARYRAWCCTAGWELKQQKPQPISGDYSITIEVERKKSRNPDLGNCHKGVSDLLVEHGVVADDSLESEIVMRWAPDVKGCRVTVRSVAASE